MNRCSTRRLCSPVIQPSKRGKRGTVPAAVQHGGGHFVSDEYTVGYHGLAHTHMDSLTHMAYQGKS